MNTLSNQTLQLAGGFLLALIALLGIIGLSAFSLEIPDILDRGLFLILGSFLGVNAVNGIRKVNGG